MNTHDNTTIPAVAWRRDLASAPLDALLLYGLTLDADDPALGILETVQEEIGLIAGLAMQARTGADFDVGELGSVLESLERRLAVSIELMRRARPAPPRDERAEAPPPEGAGA